MANSDIEDAAEGNITQKRFFLWLSLFCLAPLTCLFYELWHYPRLISGGLAMRIMAASLLVKGELP